MTRAHRLCQLWTALNIQYFGGTLVPVPIRITRSRRTYGYFNAPDNGGQPSIRISWHLARAEPDTLRNTMAHEMIHQWLHSVIRYRDWDLHDAKFQAKHLTIFGELYEEPA